MTKTPDRIVAERIISELREKRLVNDDQLEDLEKKLPTGKLSAEDWRLMAELTIAKAKEVESGKASRKTDFEWLSRGNLSSRARVRRK